MFLHVFVHICIYLHIFAYICIHLHIYGYIWQNYRLLFFEIFLYETFVSPSLLTTLLIGDLWWQQWCWIIDYDLKMAAKFWEVIHVVSKLAQPWNYINVTVAKKRQIWCKHWSTFGRCAWHPLTPFCKGLPICSWFLFLFSKTISNHILSTVVFLVILALSWIHLHFSQAPIRSLLYFCLHLIDLTEG